jgi:hypothetical protein
MLTKQGVTSAVSALLVLAVLTDGVRAAESQKQASEPFIKIREVTLGDPHPVNEGWAPYFTDAIYKKYALANWDIDKLRTYMDMLKAFGFNSVQHYDCWMRYFDAGWRIHPEEWSGWPEERPKKAEPRDWPEKMDAVADYAHSIGLRTSLFIWGIRCWPRRPVAGDSFPAGVISRLRNSWGRFIKARIISSTPIPTVALRTKIPCRHNWILCRVPALTSS